MLTILQAQPGVSFQRTALERSTWIGSRPSLQIAERWRRRVRTRRSSNGSEVLFLEALIIDLRMYPWVVDDAVVIAGRLEDENGQ